MKEFVSFLSVCISLLFLYTQPVFSQGSLAPPGPPAPMMRTLEQIEPRIPITNLPWTITGPGSYYVVTNLTGDPVLLDGIIVQANDVTIDLMGFTLQGGAGGGSGINVPVAVANLKVCNGTIGNWLQAGITAVNASSGELKDLRVSGNSVGGGGGGANIGSGWTVTECEFSNNGGPGLYTPGPSTVKSCTSLNNLGGGIAAGNSSVIIGCTANGNFMGIVPFQGGRVVDCTADGNTMNGIFASPNSALSGCTARENLQDGFNLMQNCRVANCVAGANGGNGFWTGNNPGPGPLPRSGCKLTGCTATENSQDGFNVADACTVENCVATMNSGDGIDVGNRCYVLANQCDQNGFPLGPGAGIRATGNQNRIDGNVVTMNSGPGIDCLASINNLIVRNSASVNAPPDYAIAVGNHQAAITAFPGIGFAIPAWNNFQH